MKQGPSVCVIIAAWNARDTIARALRSALAEPEVGEVIVVDDASSDGTAEVARALDDGSGRLRVIAQAENRGPSAARNAALAASTMPFVAVLDSDDFFLTGRFAHLLSVARSGADAVADNIAFVLESVLPDFDVAAIEPRISPTTLLTLERFVEGNLSKRSQPRGELGFVKPLIRRAFLQEHDLAYDEAMRLGEDYALYARMLARGARFALTARCGYVAVERGSSLSGRHATADLRALLASDRDLLASEALAAGERRAIKRHAAQIAAKLHHREVLDRKRLAGASSALRLAATEPTLLPALIGAVLRDKLSEPASRASRVRYLFPAASQALKSR